MTDLVLSGIRLFKLPSNIKLLINLEAFSIDHNHIDIIPIDLIKPLKKLYFFRFEFNPLNKLPISLHSIKVWKHNDAEVEGKRIIKTFPTYFI